MKKRNPWDWEKDSPYFGGRKPPLPTSSLRWIILFSTNPPIFLQNLVLFPLDSVSGSAKMWCTYNSFQRRWIFVRNHYDLSRRRTDPAQRPPAEAKAEGGIGGRRFPWLTCAFIFSLLLGTGTAVYAISAFSSPPPVPKSGAALTNGTDDPVDGAGDEAAGFPISEDEGGTPPVWEDAPDPPAPSGPADTADAQKPKRSEE